MGIHIIHNFILISQLLKYRHTDNTVESTVLHFFYKILCFLSKLPLCEFTIRVPNGTFIKIETKF
jgi:hypothetical protein